MQPDEKLIRANFKARRLTMSKPAEKPKAKPTAGREVDGAQKANGSAKKPPPATPYVIKRTWL